MSYTDHAATKLITTELRELLGRIERDEVEPTMLSVVRLDDEDDRSTGEYNVSVMLRPKPALRFMCGCVSMSGPNREPLACAYPPGHDGDHSWATLPTFVDGEPIGYIRAKTLREVKTEVGELVQAGIEATDDTPRTARLRDALVPFGVA